LAASVGAVEENHGNLKLFPYSEERACDWQSRFHRVPVRHCIDKISHPCHSENVRQIPEGLSDCCCPVFFAIDQNGEIAVGSIAGLADAFG
jgi:hypothetical protein